MYAETENAKYSSVVAVIKSSSSYERFENLRNSKACFAEFGGIGNINVSTTLIDKQIYQQFLFTVFQR